MKRKTRKLKVGDWIEVRSKEEILRTLDSNCQLNGMPFMPEMFQFCGKRYQVYKRAHKTCDTVFPVRGRRVDQAVHLGTRCDGYAHGGCQASCLLFWKEAWLKPISNNPPKDDCVPTEAVVGSTNAADRPSSCTESDVWARTMVVNPDGGELSYACQATQLPFSTSGLAWWDIRQYIEDYQSGNVSLWRIINGGVYFLYYTLSQAGIGVGPAMEWFYDRFHPLWRGTRFPRKTGTIPEGQPTPTIALNLRPGELVRVKSHEEILRTIDTSSRNRGMYWGPEMVPYCGRVYRVLKSVTRIINEQTGKIQEMKTPCIILDSVICQSRYSECRLFCPRSIYPFWREIWLERVEPNVSAIREGENALSNQMAAPR